MDSVENLIEKCIDKLMERNLISDGVLSSSEKERVTQNKSNLKKVQSSKTVVVYNPLPYIVQKYIHMSVNSTYYVIDSTGNRVPFQIQLCYEHCSDGQYEIFFYAILSPMGYNTYILVPQSTKLKVPSSFVKPSQSNVVSNGYYNLTINPSTGRLRNITNRNLKKVIQFSQDFWEYEPLTNLTGAHSDNWVFSPKGPANLVSNLPVEYSVIDGPYVVEIRQNFTSTHYQITRLYKQPYQNQISPPDFLSDYIDVTYLVGPLRGNKECITRITTDIGSSDTIVTDNNGFQYQRRKSNQSSILPISGNYYPIVYSSYITDQQTSLSIFPDRSHGIASLASGQVEIMLQRRLLGTFVWNITLNPQDVVAVRHHMVIDTPQYSSSIRHRLALELNFQPHVIIKDELPTNLNLMWSAMKKPLPNNVNLFTLQSYSADSDSNFVFRANHLYELGEDPVLSQPVDISLNDYFFQNVTSFEERSLSTTWKLDEMNRWKWNTNTNSEPIKRVVADTPTFTLKPKEIHTSFISFQKPNNTKVEAKL
eukprot:TRINITY_DN4885_c0_g2_i1.p1 TRINITY_DN4885_c0_g2~~TRINITY_DN4885_c0_g2_i1.p1  ORF type:complete len:536 (+),score=60.38 TRINITY_DN4885_c0_g2_i1:882-2489(+)